MPYKRSYLIYIKLYNTYYNFFFKKDYIFFLNFTSIILHN